MDSEIENGYDLMWQIKKLLNFDKYLKYPTFHNKANILVFRKMNHETNGVPVTEFVGLKWKMYLFIKNECGSVLTKCGKCFCKSKVK